MLFTYTKVVFFVI